MVRRVAYGAGTALLLGGLVLLLGRGPSDGAAAEQNAPAQEMPADLACISGRVELFVSVRLGDLWAQAMTEEGRQKVLALVNKDGKVEDQLGVKIDQIERVTMVMLGMTEQSPPVVIIRTREPYPRERGLKLAGGEPKEEMAGGKKVYSGARQAVCLLDDRSYAFGPSRGVQQLLGMAADNKDGPLSSALKEAAGKHLLVQAGSWTGLFKMLENQLPPPLEPFKALFKAQTSLLVMDLEDTKLQMRLQATFPSEKEAEAAIKPARGALQMADKGLEQGLKEMRRNKEMKTFVAQVEAVQAAVKTAQIEQKGKTVQLQASMKVDRNVGQIVLEGVQKVREAASRTQSVNNLKQIALAMHNYNDTNRALPAQAIYSKDGKPLLSWRVAILPYVDQEDLYKEFHLDEPWDSEHNKKLLEKMPKIYASPSSPQEPPWRNTNYLGFAGKGAFFDGKKGLRLPVDFPDGTSNTIMIVESSKSVPWTKPEDIDFDPDQPLPKFGGLVSGGHFLAAICDGSVRTVAKSVSKETLRNAIIRNDGNPLGSDW